MNVLVAYTVYQWKRALREPITLGWMFVLPLAVLLTFGFTPMSGGAWRSTPECSALWSQPETYAGFLMTGLIGLNTASTGIFGLGLVLVQARSLGILQRFVLTPQPAWVFVGGQMLASSAIVGLATVLLLVAGHAVLQVSWPQQLGAWSVIMALGCLTFLSLGYALAASMHEVRTAQVVGNTVFLLFMCLGGVWTPLTSLPTPVYWLSHILPLSHFVEALRAVGYLDQPLSAVLPALAVLVAWSLLATLVSIRQFRWSPAR